MKRTLAIALCIAGFSASAQKTDSLGLATQMHHSPFIKKSVTATGAVGFVDLYRRNFSFPKGFDKGNTTGLAPLFAKVEYALGGRIGLGLTFGYDAFRYNYYQEFTGHNGPFKRNVTNNARVVSGGLSAYYHVNRDMHLPTRWDPFAELGFTLDNIRYSAYPEGDSTVIKKDHNASLVVKLGTRYYISDQFSVYADAGYNKQAIVSVGFSCRFFNRKIDKAMNLPQQN